MGGHSCRTRTDRPFDVTESLLHGRGLKLGAAPTLVPAKVLEAGGGDGNGDPGAELLAEDKVRKEHGLSADTTCIIYNATPRVTGSIYATTHCHTG